MTGREFSEVDLDLLADYVGGALDGTPDETVVSDLVAGDPVWRAAHDSLTAAMASVGAGLRALDAEPMPDDIAVRLTAALAELPPLTKLAVVTGSVTDLRDSAPDDQAAPSDNSADDRAGDDAPVGGRRLSSVPTGGGSGGAERDGATAAARRRRLRRWSAPIAAAAGVLAFAGVGVNYLLNGAGNNASDTTASGAYPQPANAPMVGEADTGSRLGPEAAPAGRLEATPPPAQIMISGIDYRRDTLGAAARAAMDTASNAAKAAPAPAAGEAVSRDSAAPALQRLSGQAAMLACLEAIAWAHGGPISVTTVDYARYEGAPALVVRLTAADGRWAYAAGADCGTDGADADTLYRVRVG